MNMEAKVFDTSTWKKSQTSNPSHNDLFPRFPQGRAGYSFPWEYKYFERKEKNVCGSNSPISDRCLGSLLQSECQFTILQACL